MGRRSGGGRACFCFLWFGAAVGLLFAFTYFLFSTAVLPVASSGGIAPGAHAGHGEIPPAAVLPVGPGGAEHSGVFESLASVAMEPLFCVSTKSALSFRDSVVLEPCCSMCPDTALLF